MSFWSISRPRPQNGPMKLPEGRFGAFPSPGRRMGPGSLQKAILEDFQAQAAEWAQEAPRNPFYSISKPRPQNGPKKLRERHCGAFPSPGARMGPGSSQNLILKYFRTQAAECAQGASRKSFWSISKPRPQNEPRKLPEGHFEAFPNPGRRMGLGSLQKAILEHFQAQAAE